jgi:rubrerythrin
MNKIYQAKHELWLKVLFTSFAISDEQIKSTLYDFSQILFRHLKWISNELKEQEIEYNYDKSEIDIQKTTNFEFFNYLIEELNTINNMYLDTPLFERVRRDEEFFVKALEILLKTSKDANITAFNKERIYPNKVLDKTQTDALTIFLFEELYKEYELILIYSYMQNYTNDITQYNVYQDLIDESHYHLKSFGNMMSKMGILAIPRLVHEHLYKRDDIQKFLVDGIEEEKGAKEECKKLSEAVNDEELSHFFNFINFQESWHIELMQKLLKD